MHLLLVAILHGWAAPPQPATEDVDDPFEFIVTADPLGQGDDRTAKRAQEAALALEPRLTPCRTAALQQGEQPLRFVQFVIKIKPSDGRIRHARVASSSGVDRLDACLLTELAAVRIDPPPKFADRLELNLTWAVVKPDEGNE